MSRIIETTNVTLTSEAVSPVITIRWNPLDNSGVVEFQVQRMESIDGVFQRMVPEASVVVTLEDLLPRSFVVGETEVPTALMMGYIKAAFDALYTEATTPPPPPEE